MTDLGETLAHELGHYFNLVHTHESLAPTDCLLQPLGQCTGPEDLPPMPWPRPAQTLYVAPNACVAGDFVTDTPTDPYEFDCPPNAPGTSATFLYGAGSVSRAALRSNLMSYYCGLSTLTPRQVVRAHQGIEVFRQHVLWSASQATTAQLGGRCGGPNGGATLLISRPRRGSTVPMCVSGARANAAGSILLSLPGVPLQLGPCVLQLDLASAIAFLPMVTNSQGAWQGALSIPGSVGAVMLTFQGLMLGGSGFSGLDMTDGILVTLGS